MPQFTLNVKGETPIIEADSHMPLLWALRDLLELTGTKYGYGIGMCGACQSGQIMSTATLLASNPHPIDAQIDDAMMGNFCRCANYFRKAIHRAGKAGDEV